MRPPTPADKRRITPLKLARPPKVAQLVDDLRLKPYVALARVVDVRFVRD
jgi:hypothetical protein